ncbi:MAG: Gfo/Idh/MocA family oxidoreductase [Candidatus Lokiarchaeota archaeon]|nr:Gfo/Idh/MocA family oxidoreductase [Candidatus Lokiarchaeota archaeon]
MTVGEKTQEAAPAVAKGAGEKGVLRFGVIGCGGRAEGLTKTLMRDKRGDLVAICDTDPEQIDHYEKLARSSLGHGTKHYSDYKELLDNPDIDAVIIATPDQWHHDMAVHAFKQKKHVFLEKPVGINLGQTADILRAARQSGKILEVGYVLRYTPFYQGVRSLVQGGEIGSPLTADALEQYYGAFHFYRGWWKSKGNNGGIMVQKICHDMDLWYWIFGKPRRIVSFENLMDFKPGGWDSDAKSCNECKNHCPYYIPPEGVARSKTKSNECVYNDPHDITDSCNVLIQFESGMTLSQGMNFYCARSRSDRFLHVVGSTGEVSGWLSQNMIRYDKRHGKGDVDVKYLQFHAMGADGHGGGDDVQIIEFLNGLVEGREALAGMESAYWSSIIIMGAQMSADQGRVIDVKELTAKYPFP